MIKSLALTNFKSIGKTLIVNDEEIIEDKLEFAPLTIFCGKNSSGKSTVLQSILLLAQTLQNNILKQTLVLNGPMLKLGTVNDIKSDFFNSKNITFDMDFIFPSTIQDFQNDCIEELIKVEGLGELRYFLSNNINDIEKAIFPLLGYTFNLKDARWLKNSSLSLNVQKIMEKYKLIYSMTTFFYQGIRHLVVNKHFENEWFITSFKDNIIHENKKNINMRITFCSKNENDISNIIPLIKQININTGTIDFTATPFRNKSKNLYNLINAIDNFNSFEYYDIKFDNNTKKEIEEITSKNKLIGLNLNHFIPEKFCYERNITKEYVNSFSYHFLYRFLDNKYKYFIDQSIKDFNASIEELFILLKEYLGNKDIQLSQIIIPINILINDVQTFKKCVKKSILQLKRINIDSLLYDYCNSLYKNKIKKENSSSLIYKLFPEYNYFPACSFDLNSFKKNTNIITNYFVNNIYYLGPLREEPHLQYDKYVNDIINIGIKGENCAGVLYFNKNKVIKYIDPLDIEAINKSINHKESQLLYVLNSWIKYIEIANEVYVTFNGRYGYELRIESLGKNTKNDLTNVGVGVSQVLPIILLCLLAPEKSTIIIEQPELHLHPAMQSKLTDFFVATILCNKQLIIETHSEYIINRLRLRAINLTTKKPINDSIKIYFTENLKENYKNYKKGNTIFKMLEINEYAAMSDWPEGFFDESSKIADDLFNMASQKWKQKMDENNG